MPYLSLSAVAETEIVVLMEIVEPDFSQNERHFKVDQKRHFEETVNIR